MSETWPEPMERNAVVLDAGTALERVCCIGPDGSLIYDAAATELRRASSHEHDPAYPANPRATLYDQPENAIERHVAEVINDLTRGRVVPKLVDAISDAVARARTNAAAGRAIGQCVR